MNDLSKSELNPSLHTNKRLKKKAKQNNKNIIMKVHVGHWKLHQGYNTVYCQPI